MTFSVIIPTYNRADLLIKCLDSLLDQTFKDFEVIVCDDGSTDNTEHVVNEFRERLPQLKYLRIPNSGGCGRPRNVAMGEAVGEWVSFVDSDDLWHSRKLEVTQQAIENGIDVIYHDLNVTNEAGKVTSVFKGKPISRHNPFVDLLENGNKLPLSSVSVRKELLDEVGFFEDNVAVFRGIEDYDLWLRIAKAGGKFKYIETVLGEYLVHGANMTNSNQELRALDLVQKYAAGISGQDKRRINYAILYRKGMIVLKDKKYSEALNCFRQTMWKGSTKVKLKSVVRFMQTSYRLLLQKAGIPAVNGGAA